MAKNTKPMTKAEMIEALAKTTGTTKVAADEMYTALIALTAKETKKGPFTLPGLGKFTVVQRKARMGRNPATGKAMKIAAKKAVKFTVSKLIKDKILVDKILVK
ncbi:MAG: HU family DNA-binding protein [Kiritimatiellia bacterium]